MNNIVEFNSEHEFEKFKSKIEVDENFLGNGKEGSCYEYKDEAYKILEKENRIYDINNIITQKNVQLDSFAFPKQLFEIKGKIVAYTSKLIKNNIFIPDNTCRHDFVNLVDYKKLELAYLKMRRDIVELTKKGIYIYDLPSNLIFDEESLVAVDTCFYYYVNNIDDKLLKANLKSLNDSIRSIFSFNISQETKNNYKLDQISSTKQYIKSLNTIKKELF